MRKFIICSIWGFLLIGSMMLVNCSNPLRSSDLSGTGPVPGLDSIFSFDTLHVIDTLTQYDTLMIVDTITIIEPGTGQSQILCGRISATRKDLVWMFRNPEGDYKLEFTAFTERDKPIQELKVVIDSHEVIWNPGDNPELLTNLLLSQNTALFISALKPPSLGHSIDICLTISANE